MIEINGQPRRAYARSRFGLPRPNAICRCHRSRAAGKLVTFAVRPSQGGLQKRRSSGGGRWRSRLGMILLVVGLVTGRQGRAPRPNEPPTIFRRPRIRAKTQFSGANAVGPARPHARHRGRLEPAREPRVPARLIRALGDHQAPRLGGHGRCLSRAFARRGRLEEAGSRIKVMHPSTFAANRTRGRATSSTRRASPRRTQAHPTSFQILDLGKIGTDT